MEIVIRSSAIYFLIWFLVRVMGKRELSQMSAFELVLLVTMGDLVQQGATQEDMSVTGAFLAIGTLGFWILVWSYVSFRWTTTRRAVEGAPVIVIRDGRIQQEALRIERVTVDELTDAAREQGIADLREVKFGVLEATGKFSFLTFRDTDRRRRESGTERVAE
ncbi:MAG TPA: YetF domain-containing protein [Actinomycetota bacterium]|jgi:uncharacterized membrane protein YcaP (DUF421 family)|nr:YetF domain-containing protein [Actinomycetota bacterium]